MSDRECKIREMMLDELVAELSKTNNGKHILLKASRRAICKILEQNLDNNILEFRSKFISISDENLEDFWK